MFWKTSIDSFRFFFKFFWRLPQKLILKLLIYQNLPWITSDISPWISLEKFPGIPFGKSFTNFFWKLFRTSSMDCINILRNFCQIILQKFFQKSSNEASMGFHKKNIHRFLQEYVRKFFEEIMHRFLQKCFQLFFKNI